MSSEWCGLYVAVHVSVRFSSRLFLLLLLLRRLVESDFICFVHKRSATTDLLPSRCICEDHANRARTISTGVMGAGLAKIVNSVTSASGVRSRGANGRTNDY